MNSASSLLILSAGRGIGLDGFHKLHLVSPASRETILTRYRRQLSDDVVVVVGYRAPELMAQHPDLSFVYNYKWFESGSGFSAGLGLARVPVIVVPSDLFLDDEAARIVRESVGNAIFVSQTENRPKTAVNITAEKGRIVDIYEGPKRRGDDPEFRGIVKIEELELANLLTQTCLDHPQWAFSECISKHKDRFDVVNLGHGVVSEMNSVDDYMEFFRRDQANAHT